jgi:hypothetical protein
MRAFRRFWAIALLLLVATGLPALARAEPERVNIQFESPKGCSDGGAFLRALRRRTSRFLLATGSETARRFVVTLSQTNSSVLGRLEIQGPGSTQSLRNVAGRTCDEVVAAIALVTALAIDPGGLPEAAAISPPSPPASTPSPSAAPQRRADEARKANQPAPAAPPAPATPPALPPPPAPAAPALPPPPDQPSAESWRWAAGIAGEASLGMAPTTGWGGLGFVETAAPGGSGAVLRMGVSVSQSDTTLASGAGARFQWAAALLEGCPIRLGVADARIALFPCLAFHLGVLRGQGRHLDQPDKTTSLWADLGPVARVRVAISTHLSFDLQGMLVFPLRRLTFEVQDGGPSKGATTVFAVPTVGALAGIGVTYEFR